MGYKPTAKLYNLQFADFPGLEISAHGTSLGKLLHLSRLNVQINEPDEEKRMEVFTMFASRLVAWNIDHPELENPKVEDGKEPVCAHCGITEGVRMSCTITSLLCLELSFIMRIIIGWMGAIAQVSVPKDLSLSSGENNIQEELMRKLAEHPNLLTSPMPNLS